MLGITCSFFNDMLLEGIDCYQEQHTQTLAKPAAYHDSQWPDLYTEANEMMESIILLSSLVHIRKHRMDAATGCGRMSQVPISHAEIMNFLIKNQSKFQKRLYGEDSPLDMTKQRSRVTGTTILFLYDKETEKQYKYSISVNHQRKRATVCFRHAKLSPESVRLVDVVNPARSIGLSRTAQVALHGSLLSLVNPSLRHKSKSQPGTHVWSEFQKILDAQLRPILDQNGGYQLYATGFNNGAALATMFAFYIASQPDETLLKPVSLITFGSPYVGDQSFRDAHQCLEASGRLRHLRISNHLDYTPLTPQLPPLCLDVFNFKAFKHVGIHLKLYDELLPPEVSFACANNGFLMNAINELNQTWGESILANMPLDPLEWPEHRLKDYVDRLLANKALLEGVHLNQLYARVRISFEKVSASEPFCSD